MNPNPRPSWVLLARCTPQRLRQAIDDGPLGARWRLVEGTQGVHAIVDDEPGTEHSGERELAEALSAGGRCLIGYFDPPWISTCERGRWVGEAEGDPYALAASLGCALRAPPAPVPLPPVSALLAISASPDALARALGSGWPPAADEPLHVIATRDGALAWEDGGDLIDSAMNVARKLRVPLWTVERRADGSLRCELIENAHVVAKYDHPPSWWSERPCRLTTVLGETEPEAILARMGFPLRAKP